MEALEKYQSEVEYRKNQLKNAVEVAEFDVETGHCIPSDMTVLPDGQNGIRSWTSGTTSSTCTCAVSTPTTASSSPSLTSTTRWCAP